MPKNCTPLGEDRKLTAACLNIMAAGLMSAGCIPALTSLTLDGWSERTRALLLLPIVTFGLGSLLHAMGRVLVRDVPMKPPRTQNADFPTDRDVDEVIEEHDGDMRTAIKALLHDLNEMALDSVAERATGADDIERPRRRA